MGEYDDIINLPHHVSATRPRMSTANRAAQFAPFSALSGHDAAIKETARLTDKRTVLDQDAKDRLAEKLNLLADMSSQQPEVTITYFKPDDKKQGGSYITTTGTMKKIDEYEHVIIMTDERKIPIDDTVEIDSELLKAFF